MGGPGRTAWWIVLTILVCLAALPTGTATAQPRPQVVAAVVRDWPPYYGVDSDDRPVGFAVDTLGAVAELAELEVTCRIYEDFPSAIDALRRGEVDLIPSLGVTDSRREHFDFTSPLETFDVALFIRSETRDVEGLDDLAGRPVGVVESNVGRELIGDDGGPHPVIYEDVRTALYELLAGRVDALIYPRPVILSLARQAELQDKIEVVGPPLAEVKRSIAVQRGDPLLARLEPAATRLAGSPRFAEIYGRWFTPELPFWTVGRVGMAAGATGGVVLLLLLVWRKRWHRRVATAITGRERAEQARQRTEGRYERLLEQASDGIFISDGTGRYTEVNRRGCEMVGYTREEILSRSVADLLAPGEMERRPLELGDLEVGRTHLSLRRLRRSDGSTFPAEISATALEDGSYLGIVRDISERLEAEESIRHRDEQLRQAQKMEAIGRLAGGVAHDFNNLLTVILGNAEALRPSLEGQGPERELLDEMAHAGSRAADLTRQLLAFSRKQVVRPEPLDLRAVVSAVQRMLERIIGEDITLTVETPDEPCPILVDRAQLEQVLLNLVVNARDAMPAGGALLIRCGNQPSDDGGSGWVVLEVHDTGQGMGEEILAHLFEPFYTTKGPGSGTGLGLATVQSIVEQAGGGVSVQSAPGQGARFRIRWPRHEGAATSAPAKSMPAAAPPTRRHRILVVEDEDGVRRIVVRSLSRGGFDVTEAAGADEALRLVEGGPTPDLLITDVVMPDMGGVELAARLADRYPDLPVLFMSGYPQQSLAGALEPRGRAFVAKPFSHHELLAKVIALLEDP